MKLVKVMFKFLNLFKKHEYKQNFKLNVILDIFNYRLRSKGISRFLSPNPNFANTYANSFKVKLLAINLEYERFVNCPNFVSEEN